MWSAGVCLYVMLIGTTPFYGNSIEKLYAAIKKGDYEYHKEVISAEAKHLLKSLICVNISKRLSASETLKHPWLQRTQEKKGPIDLSRPDLHNIIFTPKEIETYDREFLTRLAKLKQQKLR